MSRPLPQTQSSASASAESTTQPAWMMPLIIIGFLLSGMAGLIDEVVWSKALPLFIGGTTLSHTIVLATFMGGLALGNYVFGRWADVSENPLRVYALLELGVGVLCLAFPEIFDGVSKAYVTLAGPLGFGNPWTLVLKVLLAATVVLVPTFLMGGTLPILARIVVRDLDEVTNDVGRLYTINSLGAIAGVALGGFVLIPLLGLDMTIRLSAGINLCLALVFFLASRVLPTRLAPRLRDGAATPDAPPGAGSSEPPGAGPQSFSLGQARLVLLVIGLSGAVSMLYELVWTRLLSLVMGSSTYSFTIMLLTFISGITMGAYAVSRAFSRDSDPIRWLAYAELAVFASILPLVPLYDQMPFTFAAIASVLDRSEELFGVYLLIKVTISFVLMFLPCFFIGMTLPLASRVAVERLSVVGRRVGSVFSINTLGTVIGATLTGLVLIPSFDLQTTLQLGIFASAALGILLLGATSLPRRRRGLLAGGALALFALVVGLSGSWDPLMLHFGLYRHKHFAVDSYEALQKELSPFVVEYAHDGADTSVAILRDSRDDDIYMKVNGKTDAGTGSDMTTQLWLGHLGMFLSSEAVAPDSSADGETTKALVIGLGSGITAGSVLSHPRARVDVVEISEAVVEGSRYFSAYNGDIFANPNFHLHVGDAKEFFKLRPRDRYELIVSEPSNPWISGIGNLFSLEYFAEIKGHLTSSGVLVQWIHLYELNDELLSVILNTVRRVFPHVEIWQCNTWDILIAASRNPLDIDPEHLAERLATPSVAADLNREHLGQDVRSPAVFLLNQVLSGERFDAFFPGKPPYNSDRHPILEYRAPAAFFAGKRATLLWKLDERRVPLARNRTQLAELLRGQRISSRQIEAAVRYLEGRRGESDEWLLRAIAWTYRLIFPGDAFGRALYERYLDEALARDVTIHAGGDRGWLRATATMIPQATSVLFTPNARPYLEALDAFVGSGDAALRDPDFVAIQWQALASLGELQRLEAWPRPFPEGRPSEPEPWTGARLSMPALHDFLLGVGYRLAGESDRARPLLDRLSRARPDIGLLRSLLH